MKGRTLKCLAIAAILCVAGQARAQQPEGLSKGTLQEQFDYMVNESSRYQSFKVIQQSWLQAFWTNLQDSLRARQGTLKANELTMAVQNKDIDTLQAKVAKLEQEKDTLAKEKNSLSLLGISMDKAVYHVLVWTIIGGLLLGLLFFLGRFRYANAVTRRMRADNRELQETVEQQRKRMLEKEQELRRQLQDEINRRLGS